MDLCKEDTMETILEPTSFVKLLRQKGRSIVYTAHSLRQARKRKLIVDSETQIIVFDADITKNVPSVVVEQTSENPEERKFKLYYRSSTGGFSTYVVTIDGVIRLITIYRTSKSLQKNLYKHVKPK